MNVLLFAIFWNLTLTWPLILDHAPNCTQNLFLHTVNLLSSNHSTNEVATSHVCYNQWWHHNCARGSIKIFNTATMAAILKNYKNGRNSYLTVLFKILYSFSLFWDSTYNAIILAFSLYVCRNTWISTLTATSLCGCLCWLLRCYSAMAHYLKLLMYTSLSSQPRPPSLLSAW